MDKIYLEYEQCQCSKFEKKVTVTSMVIEDPNPDERPYVSVKQAFDCDQKIACGVFIILGKKWQLNWAKCTHPKLAEVAGSGSG